MSPRWRHRFGVFVLAIWLPATTVVVGSTMGLHLVALPGPDRGEVVVATLAAAGRPDRVVHVVPAGCSCTRSLIDHLVGRGADDAEEAWLVGALDDEHQRLRAAGYAVRSVTAEQLAEGLTLKGGPALFVLRGGELAYAGGYYATPAANRPLDVTLMEEVARGERPDPLPLFGCATEPNLARRTDPFSLR